MVDGASNEPVVVALPTPISVAPGEAQEVARQADEAKAPKPETKEAPAKAAAKEEAKPLSIKESLAKAREKIEAAPATPAKPLSVAAKEASAEPVAKEVKPDAKDADGPTRGEDGKFTAKVTEPASKADAQVAKADEATGKADQSSVKSPASVDTAKPVLPSHTANPPPARFSQAAKERWAEAPEEVRAETERAVTELTKGFEKHRAAAERDGRLASFHEMAAKGNTTVEEALGKYVGMEQALRNPETRDKGLESLFQNMGINSREWAAKILNQSPDQAASQQDATIRELRAELNEIKQGLGTLHQERAQAKTDTTTEAVAKFAAENPRFEELADDISFFLKSGRTKDLAEAYSLAERLNPAPAAQAQATPEPVASIAPPAPSKPTLVPSVAQNRDAGTRSIAGTPTAGSDPVRRQPSSSIKEALRRAAAAAG